MSFVRRFGILILGIVVLAIALGAIALTDYVEVVTPPETTFVFSASADTILIFRTYAMNAALAAGTIMIAIWVGLRGGSKSAGSPRGVLARYWALSLGIITAVGAIFYLQQPVRGEFTILSPDPGPDYFALGLLLRNQVGVCALALGLALVAGWIAWEVRSRQSEPTSFVRRFGILFLGILLAGAGIWGYVAWLPQPSFGWTAYAPRTGATFDPQPNTYFLGLAVVGLVLVAGWVGHRIGRRVAG
jgi:hypothetical protein